MKASGNDVHNTSLQENYSFQVLNHPEFMNTQVRCATNELNSSKFSRHKFASKENSSTIVLYILKKKKKLSF